MAAHDLRGERPPDELGLLVGAQGRKRQLDTTVDRSRFDAAVMLEKLVRDAGL